MNGTKKDLLRYVFYVITLLLFVAVFSLFANVKIDGAEYFAPASHQFVLWLIALLLVVLTVLYFIIERLK